MDQLDRNRPLAVDHIHIIERVQKDCSCLVCAAERFFAGLVIVCTVKDDLGSKSACGRGLHQRSHERHHDLGANASCGRMVGHGLGMIAGARRDHPAPLFLILQSQNPVESAALLEGPRPLQIVELEINPLARRRGKFC